MLHLRFPFFFNNFLLILVFHMRHDTVSGSLVLCTRPTTSFISKYFTRMCLLVDPVYCSRDPQISFFNNFSLKMGHTTLFTYLKIILLQYFQFSQIYHKRVREFYSDTLGKIMCLSLVRVCN